MFFQVSLCFFAEILAETRKGANTKVVQFLQLNKFAVGGSMGFQTKIREKYEIPTGKTSFQDVRRNFRRNVKSCERESCAVGAGEHVCR